MEIEQLVSYIVVALTSLSTVLAWVASCIKSLSANKKFRDTVEALKEEVKETKAYKEMRELVQKVIDENAELKKDNAELKRILKDTMTMIDRVERK